MQVAVLIIDRMAPGSSDTDAMNFAKSIHELWGVGDRTCNNGVVFLMALGDRKWYVIVISSLESVILKLSRYISTGVGVNQILTEYAISHIKDSI